MAELDDLLATCLEAVESGRCDVAAALAACGEHAAELAPLVEVALRLRLAERPVPSASFRNASRSRLLARIGATKGHVNGHGNGVRSPPR